MKDLYLKNSIISLEVVDSTNNYAARLIKDEEPDEGTVILADFQKSGRGQRNQVWDSEKAKNLTFSIILYPDFLKAENHFYISMAISIGIVRYLQSLTDNVKVKWPNDIYIENKKIAGILIENSLIGSYIKNSIIGIGLNVNQINFPDFKPAPTSMAIELKKEFKREKVLNELLQYINSWIAKLYDNKLPTIKKTFESLMLYRNEPVVFTQKNLVFTGIIMGVNDFGQLIVKKEGDVIQLFNFKEIEFPK